MNVKSHISVGQLRSQAKRQLLASQPQHKTCLSSEVELTTLNLIEEFVRSEPSQAITPGQATEGKDPASRYGNSLAQCAASLAGAGAGHTLARPIQKALSEIRWWSLKPEQAEVQTMGTMLDLAAANKAVGPKESMDWGVQVTGHWTDEQKQNVQNAVLELGRKTGTKAINLLREVHLRTELGGLEHGPILGLTKTVGAIALRRDQADHSGRTRWLVFHEVGHQLDRFLSGRSTSFRSHQPDSPFGQSDNPSHYIDGNQVGSPHEDFADCHARALYDYDDIQDNPDLYLHARGRVGEKMAWILEQGYKDTVRPPSASYTSLLRQVNSGESPFADQESFHAAVNLYLDHAEALPTEKRRWLDRNLRR